jgi:hypothetical protein
VIGPAVRMAEDEIVLLVAGAEQEALLCLGGAMT